MLLENRTSVHPALNIRSFCRCFRACSLPDAATGDELCLGERNTGDLRGRREESSVPYTPTPHKSPPWSKASRFTEPDADSNNRNGDNHDHRPPKHRAQRGDQKQLEDVEDVSRPLLKLTSLPRSPMRQYRSLFPLTHAPAYRIPVAWLFPSHSADPS
jgi:hypothetical protein